MSKVVSVLSTAFILALLALVTTVSVQVGRVLAAPPVAGSLPVIGPLPSNLEAALNAAGERGQVSVLVKMVDQADVTSVSGSSRVARLEQVVTTLQTRARATQGPVNALLAARKNEGKVSNAESLWIFNGFAVTATPAVIREIASLPEVAGVALDRTISAPVVSPSAATSEANISLINVPAVWSLGYTGQNIVVASLDTGVDGNHPDLLGRWRGGSNSWFDPNGQHPSFPYDASGHGTATMGIMVGGGAGGTNVGVAPGAKWISAKIFDDQGSATLTSVHRAFQWVLDPDGNPSTADAPDVVNNSWTDGSVDCSFEFQSDLRALGAAGILPIFAAGNYGPSTSSSPSPANLPEAFAVGAIDNTGAIAYFSSRGPAACGQATTIYPAVVAPGVSVRSDGLGGSYASNSGTSFAAPHAAGVLALLLSANPNLTIDQQRQALVGSAKDLGPTGSDNSYGSGRIDALAAYDSVASFNGTVPTLSVDTIVTGKYSGKGSGRQFNQASDFTAGDKVVIRAHAIDGDGLPLSGATVSIAVRAPSGGIVASTSPVTDTSGVAEFSYPTSRKSTRGTYTVEVNAASKSGYSYSPKLVVATFMVN